jgi:hypothetical protein
MSDTRAILQKKSGEASLHRLWIHTVAIVNGIRVVGKDPTSNRLADGEEFGSGCAARWGKHHFILTAKHVLRDAKPTDLRIFCCPSGGLEYRAPADLRKQDVVDAVPIAEQNAAIHRCEWEDLALMTTIPKAVGQYVEFFDLAKDWIDPPEGERVHCFGFPSDGSIPWEIRMIGNKEERQLAVYPGLFDGAVTLSPKFITNDFDPDIHYLIPFEEAAKGKHPRGYSGAAAWWESDQQQLVWRPNFKFAGICTSCYKNGSIEQVVKASVVRRFVEEVLGPA